MAVAVLFLVKEMAERLFLVVELLQLSAVSILITHSLQKAMESAENHCHQMAAV